MILVKQNLQIFFMPLALQLVLPLAIDGTIFQALG